MLPMTCEVWSDSEDVGPAKSSAFQMPPPPGANPETPLAVPWFLSTPTFVSTSGPLFVVPTS
jgi:hypothetical protein